MVTKKDRRHSGYISPRATVSFRDLIKYDLFINDFYDDWTDYRDGFRDWFRDFKLIKKIKPGQFSFNHELVIKRLNMNKKQKLLLRRRNFKEKRDENNRSRY